MEKSILQQIETLKNVTAERTDAIKEDIFDALARHGITHVTDDDIEIYSNLYIENGEIAIGAEADYDAANRELQLTEQDMDYRYRGTVSFDNLHGEARLMVLEWLANILDGIDSGALRVIGGRVKPFVFLPGDKVRWNDPNINDFDPEDRQAQAKRVYTVYKADENIVCFSDGVSNVEAPPCEVVLVEADTSEAPADKEGRIRKQVISIMENLGGIVTIPENIGEILDWLKKE